MLLTRRSLKDSCTAIFKLHAADTVQSITFAIFTLHTFFLHNTIQGIERKKDEKMVLSFISCFIYLMFDLFVRKKTDLS